MGTRPIRFTTCAGSGDGNLVADVEVPRLPMRRGERTSGFEIAIVDALVIVYCKQGR